MKKNMVIGGVFGVIVVLSLFFFFSNNNNQITDKTVSTKPVVEVYLSPTCGCCKNYIKYLEARGFRVESKEMFDLNDIKDSFGIPQNMQSCHTTKIGDYFVEGHVPMEAIQELSDKKPEIDGIALPGMPSGSPGMSGAKTQPFVIYSISQGEVSEFVRI